jgi:hypothetical protein
LAASRKRGTDNTAKCDQGRASGCALDDAVAEVATTHGRQKRASLALDIAEWNEGANAKLSTGDIVGSGW